MPPRKLIVSKVSTTAKGFFFWTEIVGIQRKLHEFKTRKETEEARAKFIKDHPEGIIL